MCAILLLPFTSLFLSVSHIHEAIALDGISYFSMGIFDPWRMRKEF